MTSRKDKIKNITIIFLLFMLVLTFFSNTIMNYSLVEVSTQMIMSDSITSKVRGSGTVEASDSYAVTMKESRKIATVAVKTGAEVEQGDVLFTLVDAESDELVAARKSYEEAKLSYESAVLSAGLTIEERKAIEAGKTSSLTEKQTTLLNAQAVVDNAQANYDAVAKQAAANTTVDSSAEQAALIKAQQEKIAVDAEVTTKSNAYTEAEAAYTKLKNYDPTTATTAQPTEEEIAAAKKAMDDAWSAYIAAQQKAVTYAQAVENAQTALSNKLGSADTNSAAQLKAAEDALTAAKADLEKVSAKLTSQITIATQYSNMESLRKEVEKLEENAIDAEVVSPIAGTVAEINYTAGQTVAAEDTMMLIQPENKAYTLKFTVTANQAKKIKVGDAADVVNNWYGNDIQASVLSIRKDTTDKSKYVVTCEISGDVNAGDNYTLSIGEKSSNYDLVVPTSSIREDNNGNFILIIESKSTPLGNRYYARRVNVEIITSDDSMSAITGALEGYEYVITTTTKPVVENQQVRLAE